MRIEDIPATPPLTIKHGDKTYYRVTWGKLDVVNINEIVEVYEEY